MGEDEPAADVADFARAGGDVGEGAPAAGEQGESAFAEAAQRAEQGVAGAAADVEVSSVRVLLDGNEDADASAVVAGIGTVLSTV